MPRRASALLPTLALLALSGPTFGAPIEFVSGRIDASVEGFAEIDGLFDSNPPSVREEGQDELHRDILTPNFDERVEVAPFPIHPETGDLSWGRYRASAAGLVGPDSIQLKAAAMADGLREGPAYSDGTTELDFELVFTVTETAFFEIDLILDTGINAFRNFSGVLVGGQMLFGLYDDQGIALWEYMNPILGARIFATETGTIGPGTYALRTRLKYVQLETFDGTSMATVDLDGRFVVPEPATGSLLALGVTCVGLRRRTAARRRSR